MIKKALSLCLVLWVIILISSCQADVKDRVIFSAYDDLYIEQGNTQVNVLEGVVCISDVDGDISDQITVKSNEIDFENIGSYPVILYCEDSLGVFSEITRWVHITEVYVETTYATYDKGIDLSLLDDETQAYLYTKLHDYLIDNVYGGIPLYTNASGVLFSHRVSHLQDSYHYMFGYGEQYASLNDDDAQVLISNQTYGNSGDYTWRDAYTQEPLTFNNWISYDAASLEVIKLMSASLYKFDYDESGQGFILNEDLAQSDPIPLDGEESALTWQIPIKDNLTWQFSHQIDISNFDDEASILDANDYYWTWKTAIDNQWFRAVSGGNDFITQGIKGINAYINKEIDFDEVGITLLDDQTLELQFEEEKSMFEVKYMLSNTGLAPVQKDLYELYGDSYGDDETKIASTGIYVLEEYIEGQSIKLSKNDDYPNKDQYHFSQYMLTYYENDDAVQTAFAEGYLDIYEVSIADLEKYEEDPRLKLIYGTTIYSLYINMFGTNEQREMYIEENPLVNINESFVLEPIL
jgi:ABC-type oligopeptide transport system substrate-binding subunit